MWNLTVNREPKGQQEIKVKMLLKEMAEYSYATYAEAFQNHFNQLIKDIPRSNNYSADLIYKVTQRNLKSVEVWKMKPNGDFNYKMFTLFFVVS